MTKFSASRGIRYNIEETINEALTTTTTPPEQIAKLLEHFARKLRANDLTFDPNRETIEPFM